MSDLRRPLVLVNAVGMTPRLLEHAPRLKALADQGWVRSLNEVFPAVTCTAQATLLTGALPHAHGIVGNGWLFRDTQEVRFWQQANSLLEAEPFYLTARRRARERGVSFRSAKLFWWFNQGAAVDLSVTPKPYYGADGNKAFGISGTPEDLCGRLEQDHGKFPFHTFWGPGAGLPCTQWIARCAADIQRGSNSPDLSLVYLPHLDYDPQRFGPSGCDMPRLVRELDEACEPLLDACRATGARVWVVSEYGHCDVTRPVYLNLVLRQAGLLTVRQGPFGEMLDLFASRAFAVVDHQLAHVYVRESEDLPRVRDLLQAQAGVDRVLAGEQRAEIGLDHPRSGELVVLSHSDAWFAYPYWLEDAFAPDFARTVDIHRKPGYDPCELFFDPKLTAPKLRAGLKLLRKKLGFRTLFNLIPLDASLVRGSHGLAAANEQDRPLLIGDGPAPCAASSMEMARVAGLALDALGLAE